MLYLKRLFLPFLKPTILQLKLGRGFASAWVVSQGSSSDPEDSSSIYIKAPYTDRALV